MADTNQNLVNFRLTGTLSISGTEVNVSNDIIRDTAIAITDASITLTNDARTNFELVVGTIASGVLTLSKRGITEAQTQTENSAYKREWRPGTIGYVTLFASDTLDIDVAGGTATIKNDITFTGDNTFNGASKFNGIFNGPTFADTTARDAVYTSPVSGDKCVITGTGEQYYDGGAWNTLGVGSPTPFASTTVAGTKENPTDAQVTAGTDIGETGATMSPLNSQIKKSISLKTAGTTFGDTDEIVVNVSGEDLRITGANLRESISASATVKGTVELATDAEVIAGTDETRYVNPKQAKDNYGITVISGDTLILSNTNSVSDTTGVYVKKREILLGKGGIYKVAFLLKSSNTNSTVYGRLYVNGIAVGIERSISSTSGTTYTEDITVASGDLLQLYLKGDAGNASQNNSFTISCLVLHNVVSTVVNM